jgi:2-methylcitrate dehydratase PrpD
MNETRDLVNFALNISYDDLPGDVIETAKMCVLDTVGVALYGGQMQWSKIVMELAKEGACAAESGVWGQNWKTSAQYAALANGTSAHGIEMDDRSENFDIHCGAAVIPAVIAMWEKTKTGGKEVIEAIVAGYEVTYRLCDAMRGCARQRFYGSPIKNIFGSTVTAGKMLGLDSEAMLNAMGIAGSMASGLREWTTDPKGTMVKRFNGGGWPSHNGVLAALLAQKGLTGPGTILEGERGVCRAFGIEKEPQIGKLTEDLGKHYMIMLREIKPYGTCGGLQRGVEAVNELKQQHGITPDQIEHIDIGCSFKVFDQHDSKKPESIMAAQYSLPFVAALAFFRDLADPSSWNESALSDSKVVELVQKVDMQVDEELDKIRRETNAYGPLKMKVRLKDGQEHQIRIEYFKGQVQNPAAPEDIVRKFNVMAKHVFPQKRLDQIAQIVDRLEQEQKPDNLSKALMKS